MRSRINVFSRKVVQISTKPSNTPTSLTHTVEKIVQKISLTGDLSPQNITYSMAIS